MIARLTIFLVFVSTIAIGQVQNDSEIQNENFVQRIKNIEFFMERFNSASSLPDTVKRPYQMATLFDLSKLATKVVTPQSEIANDFLKSVCWGGRQVLLNFNDSSWFAELSITTKSSGVLTCLLGVTKQSSGHGWSVIAMTPEGKQTERFRSAEIVFPPNANGTDFMSVLIAFRDGKIEAVNKLNIRSEMIQRIRYHFLQVDGWIFTVDYVDRDSKNSGWLVHEVVKATPEDKLNYRRKLHLD